MLEFIDSLPCPAISMAGFFILYIGTAVIGSLILLAPVGRSINK